MRITNVGTRLIVINPKGLGRIPINGGGGFVDLNDKFIGVVKPEVMLFDDLLIDFAVGGAGVISHNTLTDLDVDGHVQYYHLDGRRALAGHLNASGHRITNLSAPTAGTDAVNLDFVNSLLKGLDWQNSVLSKTTATPPPAPSTGDRYIVPLGATGSWDGLADYVVTWNGTTWFSVPPNPGFATLVEDENVQYMYISSSQWVKLGTIVDHNNLMNLTTGDPHAQYLPVDGSRAMGGPLSMSGFNITGVGLIDGVDVTTHATRHLPSGVDALATGMPIAIGVLNQVGSANSFSRSDHVHDHSDQPGGSLHSVATAAEAGFMSVSDKTKLDGYPSTPAGIDHNSLQNLSTGDVHTQYLLINGSRAMSGSLDMGTHNIVNAGTYNGVNVVSHATRHALNGDDPLSVGVPVTLGLENSEGTSNSYVRRDHVHAHGNQIGGSLHSVVTTAEAGFMSAADKVKLNNLSAPSEIHHNELQGLGVDDHVQYLLVSGLRAMNGNLNMSTFNIINAGAVNGIEPQSHATRHLPSGADPLSVGVPVAVGGVLAEGTANSYSRSDHVHTHGNQLGGTLHEVASTSADGFMSSADKFSLQTLLKIKEVNQEPTGAESRAQSTISFDESSRQFTITPVGSEFSYWVSGNRFTKTAAESVSITDIEGLHFIYYDGEVLVADHEPPEFSLFEEVAYMAYVYWDAVNKIGILFGDERHGTVMDWATHRYLHDTLGAKYSSGLNLSNFALGGDGSLGGHAQYGCENGVVYDEDIPIQIQNGLPQDLFPVLSAPVLYRLGSGAGSWRKKPANEFPLIHTGTEGYTGTVGRVPYNSFDGVSWQLVEANEGKFVLTFVVATNDVRHPMIIIQGTSQYDSLDDAKAGSEAEIAVLQGLPFPELMLLGAVVYQTSTSFTNAPKAVVVPDSDGGGFLDFRRNNVLREGSHNNHNSLFGLQNDDHKHYYHLDGRRALSGNLNAGGYSFTNVGTINGINILSHASRHLPNGGDPLTTSTASALNANSSTTTGSSNALARSDHNHSIAKGTPVTQLPAQSNTEGTSTGFARADHIHNIQVAAPTAVLAPSTNNLEGDAQSFSRSNHAHAVATAESSDITQVQAGAMNFGGDSNNFSRGNHVHNIATAAATGQPLAQTNAVGSSSSLARADHVHAMEVATPVVVGVSSAEGTATTHVRSDHVHAMTSTTPTQGQVVRFNGTSWQPFSLNIVYGENEVTQNTSLTTFVEALSVPFTITEPGLYLIEWYAELNAANRDRRAEAKCELNNSIILGQTTTGRSENGDTHVAMTGFSRRELSAGNHQVDLDFRMIDSSTAELRRGRIRVQKYN